MFRRYLFFFSIFCSAYFSPVSSLEFGGGQIHGFINQGAMLSNGNNYFADTSHGTFDFHEVGLNYTINLTPKLYAGIQFFHRGLGRHGDDAVVIDWAVGDYRFADEFGVRLGKIKIPLGFHNKTWDLDFARTFIFLPQGVYDELFRGFLLAAWAGEVYGFLSSECWGDLEYEFWGGTLESDVEDPLISDYIHRTTLLQGALHSYREELVMRYAYGGSLIWNLPCYDVRLGISAIRTKIIIDWDFPSVAVPGTAGSISDRIIASGLVASAEWRFRDFIFTAEYTRRFFPLEPVIIPGVGAPAVSVSNHSTRDGFYVSAEYMWNDCWTFGVYHSVFFPDILDKGSSPAAWQRDTDVTIRHDYNEFIVLKAEYHNMNGWGQLSQAPLGNPLGFTENWNLWILKASISF